MSKNTGVTVEMLEELKNVGVIKQNVMWKPDRSINGYQTFYPYLPGDFVKRRLIEVLGAQNLQFHLERDEEFFSKGSLGVLMDTGEVNYYASIGVDKEGKGLTDQEKKNKVRFKGGNTDAIKGCAEWLGLMVPEGLSAKKLKKDGDFVLNSKGERIGSIKTDIQVISNYLNGVSNSVYLLAQFFKQNKENILANEDLQNAITILKEGVSNA